MPALYAHYNFGIKVSNNIDWDLRDRLVKYVSQYETGLQGPDLFFFYKPYSSNKVGEYGHKVHSQVARDFFENAVKVVREKGFDSHEYGYINGVICHYILDSKCHPFINSWEAETGVSHMEIEEEFEKYMLRLNERDPFEFSGNVLISPEETTAKAIEPFYDEINLNEVYKSIGWMKFIKTLFCAPGHTKYEWLHRIMRWLGKEEKWKYLIHQRVDNPVCEPFNKKLHELFVEAVPEAVEAVRSFENAVVNGTPLSERFDRTFEGL